MSIRKMMLRVCALSALCPAAASAERFPWHEYDRLLDNTRTIAALSADDALGDRLDLYSGSLSFSVTDISIPGNSELPVALTRTYIAGNRGDYINNDLPLADWELDIPNVSGVFATTWHNDRCDGRRAPPMVTGAPVINADEYWHGHHASLPGGGEMLVVDAASSAPKPAVGGPYHWVTPERTFFSCLASIRNGPGQGFLAITADGTRYWLDHMAQYFEPELSKVEYPSTSDHDDYWGTGAPTTTITRRRNVLYATRVEDRFGNWVTYSYNNAHNQPARLTRVDASDGRAITVQHNASGQIASASDGSRTWTYGYQTYQHGPTTKRTLSQVTLPDASRWTIEFSGLSKAALDPIGAPSDTRSCFSLETVQQTDFHGSVTHPSGARGTFTVAPAQMGRSNVPGICRNFTPPVNGIPRNNSNDDFPVTPIYWHAIALKRRQISGPGLTSGEWTYTYGSTFSHFNPAGSNNLPICRTTTCMDPVCTSDSCAGRRELIVTGPDNLWQKNTFGNSYRYNEGKLLKIETGTGASSILRSVSNSYQYAQADQSYVAKVGTSPQSRGEGFVSEFLRPQVGAITQQQGTSFSWTVNIGCAASGIRCFDSFARPTNVTRSSTVSGNPGRIEVIQYHDNLTRWVLGQQAKLTVNGTVASESIFNSQAQPITHRSFGKLLQTLTYNADGTVATVRDGSNNTTTVSNWYRGIPRTIQYADNTTQTAVVNSHGWITQTTDQNGFATHYAYDSMGRLASIVYPTGDSTAWNTTTQAFQQIASAEYGIPAGHWRQTVATGNGRRFTYYDALWRPLVTREYDTANEAGTQRFQRFTYDHAGRTLFASYPGTTDALSTGTWTEYDALGRTSSVSQDSELGLLTTLTDYLTGFQTRVTNPRGFQTTTSYLAWDQPTYDYPTAIAHPEGAYTDIVRNAFGNPTRLTRRNANSSVAVHRHYVYDAHQQLCKSIEPETGVTVMAYDNAGNLSWSASGQNLGSTADCNTMNVATGQRVNRSYNNRNRLTALTFPDGNGNQTWTYTPDGLPATITTNNSGGYVVANVYYYNRRRMLTWESVAQQNWYEWGLGYSYDANGNLAAQSYPTALQIHYMPNALGQPTQVRDQSNHVYANAIQYHPGGAVKQFTYGNGVTFSMTENARRLPLDLVSTGGALHDRYTYDANGNVSSILDVLNGGDHSWTPRNRWMNHDGLDRLTDVGSGSFGGDHWHRFTYDALDNLKSWKLAGVKDYANYIYGTDNRLAAIQNSVGANIVNLGYDLRGNLINRNGQNYQFDYGNRLRGVTNQEYFRYDGHGRRVLASHPMQGNILSQYSQSGQILYQENHRSAIASENIYLGGKLLAVRERPYSSSTPAIVYQHTDALGSPVAVTNQSGQVLDRTNWEPYGAAINKPNYGGIGYTGHVQDAATGLTYMQQRYYDPQLGVFLSVDPVTAYGGDTRYFNRYWYAAGNPYKYTDPDGQALDIILDIGFIGYSTYKLVTEPSWTNAAALGADVVGAAVPFATGLGAGVRAAAHGADVARGADVAVTSSGRGADFIVSNNGTVVHNSPDAARASLENAGFRGEAITNRAGTETGTLHNIPHMRTDIRVMDGGPNHGPRVVTNQQGTNSMVDSSTGRPFRNDVPRPERIERSHIRISED